MHLTDDFLGYTFGENTFIKNTLSVLNNIFIQNFF